MDNPELLLVGAGGMAAKYLDVLKHLGIDNNQISLLGRGRERAESLAEKYGISSQWGGTQALTDMTVPPVAIVAVGHYQLAEVTAALIKQGCRYILVEKPGAMFCEELVELKDLAQQYGAKVFIAYNRRFYPAVDQCRQAIKEDGGLLSCRFDFTEVEWTVLRAQQRKNYSDELLSRWGIVNSLHVIDLFLFLAGKPTQWQHVAKGAEVLPWHPNASTFMGSGDTKKGVAFSYLSTWGGAGRWALELTTSERKLILCPLEELSVQYKGKFELEKIDLTIPSNDLKMGFLEQAEALLACASEEQEDQRLCPIDEAVPHFEIAEEILAYS